MAIQGNTLQTDGNAPALLAINAGSSSIRFAIYARHRSLRLLADGKVDRIGSSGTSLSFRDAGRGLRHSGAVEMERGDSAAAFLLDWLETHAPLASIKAVGHRVVHGMRHCQATRVTPQLLDELHRIEPYDPDHLPLEIELMEALRQRHPQLPQVACFDTAFHSTLPRLAALLPIPRRYAAKGVRRYGFHGLSYTYLMEQLARLDGPAATSGRTILAHLGNGASLAAVRDGRSIDTSMGFTPTGGLMMSNRSGDLDPGVGSYLARTEQMSAAEFHTMVNHASGLLGVSETSSDMRDLLGLEAHDERAAEAIAMFCYQVRKWIGAFAAALGGLDTLVFAGGIGENSPIIRERICDGLGFLGIELCRRRNAKGSRLISPNNGRIKVRVIRTDEQLVIARSAAAVIDEVRSGKP